MTLMKQGQRPSLTALIGEVQKLERERVEGKELDPKLALLKQWQSDRLARSYSDLTVQPRYRPAMRFFLEDIYAARDFSQRNRDMERLYELFRRVLPENTVRPMVLTVQLQLMTEALDEKLLDVLTGPLGMQDSLTLDLYAEAYRRCDNRAERVRQIELICEVGRSVDEAVRVPFSGPLLSMSRLPLEMAGWGDLVGLADRGYKAFKQMRGAQELLDLIRKRELLFLNRIYAGDPNPFRF
jgi:hypothetical protein